VKRLLIATRNPGKLVELRSLLAGKLPLEVLPLPEGAPEVEETGSTFVENARLKVQSLVAWSSEWALADDSGLEVDALGGAPGVCSSRYAGPGAQDADRIAKLLEALREVPPEQRTARFRCVTAVGAPDGRIWTADGTCEGVIATEPRGDHGFGYDPVFYLPLYHATMAELALEVKNRISHRAHALAAALVVLRRLCREEEP
jgi:XTP/dITP diphosphohydrolase